MAVVDLSDIGVGISIRKKLYRDLTIYPDKPYKGGGFKVQLQNGIYQMRPRDGGAICVREVFYTPTNPQTPEQQANRSKFAAGVVAWQALTPEEKQEYNRMRYGLRMSGYNLFLRLYMLN